MNQKNIDTFNKIKMILFPFLKWLPELKNTEILKADIVAGATVALVLIPQSMAYAQLAGLEAYYGLYASFLPVMIAALWGSSRQLATGPVAIVSLLSAAALQNLATSGPAQYIIYASILALIVGLIQFFMGVLKMGKLVDFLSHPVIIGFTNAAALIIGASQLNKLFGLNFGQSLSTGGILEKSPHNYQEIINVLSASVTDTHTLSLLFGLGSILMLIYIKTYFKKIPGVLIVVITFTLISWYINYKKLGGFVVGSIPSGLPDFNFPLSGYSFKEIKDILVQLFMPALTISIIGFAEAVSVAKAMASQSKQSISSNKELIGQGLANIASSINHGFPVSGSFSRSAVNFASGAKTGFSSVVTGILVGITLLFLTPLLYHLPQATLAAVIIVAVAGLIRIKPIINAWHIQKHDGFIAILVFIITLISAPHLEKGLIAGVGLSLFLFIYRSMTPRFIEFGFYNNDLRDSNLFNLKNSIDVGMYGLQGPLYFANSGYFEGKLLKYISNKKNMKLIILDFDGISEIDASGLDVLENIVSGVEKTGIKVLFTRIKRPIYKAFERVGYLEKFGEENIFLRSRFDALKYAEEVLKLDIDTKPFYKEIFDEEKARLKGIDLEIGFKGKIRKVKRIINKIRQKDLS